MMKTSTVKKVAALAKINIPKERLASLAGELSRIVEWVSDLEKVNTEGAEPLYSPGTAQMRQRADEPRPQRRRMALKNAKRAKGGFYMVPKVL